MKLSRASIGLAVKAARSAAELTLQETSKATSVSVSSLSRLENGERDLGYAEALLIAEVFQLNLEDLRTLAETFERQGAPTLARGKDRLARDLNDLQRTAIEAAIAARHRA